MQTSTLMIMILLEQQSVCNIMIYVYQSTTSILSVWERMLANGQSCGFFNQFQTHSGLLFLMEEAAIYWMYRTVVTLAEKNVTHKCKHPNCLTKDKTNLKWEN